MYCRLPVTVYTTVYDDDAPAAVAGLQVGTTPEGKPRLSRRANAEPDLCYYRVYRLPTPNAAPSVRNQIGSTVATSFVDRSAPAEGAFVYRVLAVDQSGNAGPVP